MARNNGSSDAKTADIVETEIAKGEQDDLSVEYPQLKKEKTQEKPRSKILTSRSAKRDVPRSAVKVSASRNQRIKELAKPTKQRVWITLLEKGLTLPPTFVDNLIRIIEAESCLTPEEAARVVRRKKRRAKTARLPLHAEKWAREIPKDAALDREATMCQYLMAERFVKGILGYHAWRKDVGEIADVILKRLMSFDEYVDARNDDRATQQLRLLADVVANWIAEILAEVAETQKAAIAAYCRKKKRKMIEVDEDDENDETSSETENWRQIDLKKEIRNQGENKQNKVRIKTEKKHELAEQEKNKSENDEQKRENAEDEIVTKDIKEEKDQLGEGEVKSENVRKETDEKE